MGVLWPKSFHFCVISNRGATASRLVAGWVGLAGSVLAFLIFGHFFLFLAAPFDVLANLPIMANPDPNRAEHRQSGPQAKPKRDAPSSAATPGLREI